jgi:hypothetical protein
LTYLLAQRMSKATGVVAAALVAVDPLTVGFSATLLSETPFALCLLVALWLGVRQMEEPTWGRWVALGVVSGAAVLLRGSALQCIGPLVFWIDWFAAKRHQRFRYDPLFLAGWIIPISLTFACLAPWIVRNARHFRESPPPLRLTTLEGISLYEAVYPEADGGPRQGFITLTPAMVHLNEAQQNDEWSRRAWGYIKSEPGRMLLLAPVKLARTWSPWLNASEMQSPVAWWGMTLWSVPLFALAIVGIWRSGMGWGEKGILLVPIVYFSLLHSLFLGSVRYRVPLMPLVCVFAAAGLTSLLQRVNVGRQSQRSAEPEV